MAQPRKKNVVKRNPKKTIKAIKKETKKKLSEKDEKRQEEILSFIELVECVKKTRSKKKANKAFNEIVAKLDDRLKKLAYRFKIPGCTKDDIYQESLFALRYKAIKDYDQTRSNITSISPFDRFAILCIRRHLSTKLKSSYQNKQRVWISSISIDQDRSNVGADESLFLADILSGSDITVLEDIDKKEYQKNLFTQLFKKLSVFERELLLLYCSKYSYDEIAHLINKNQKDKIKVKSVDNALSRIKLKAKSIFKKHGLK